MHTCDCETMLSSGLLRYLRAYRPRLRKYVAAYFVDRLANNPHPTMEEVQECIARAYESFLCELEAEMPNPDEATVSQAAKDYREGRWQSIEEILDEIPD